MELSSLIFTTRTHELIGLEHKMQHQRITGLRTNALVCIRATLFAGIAVHYYGLYCDNPRSLQIIAHVVSGIGILVANIPLRPVDRCMNRQRADTSHLASTDTQ